MISNSIIKEISKQEVLNNNQITELLIQFYKTKMNLYELA